MPHVDDRSGAPRGARTLPASALAGLRDAFAGEVASRLPRLQALGGPDADVAEALRDAHALGSSAVVVGEAEASRVARALEAELRDLDGRPVPSTAVEKVGLLAVLLSPWLAA